MRQARRGGAQGRGRKGRGGSEGVVRADNLKKLRLQDASGYYLSTRTTGFLPCKPSYIPVLSRNQPGAPNTVDTERDPSALLSDCGNLQLIHLCTVRSDQGSL